MTDVMSVQVQNIFAYFDKCIQNIIILVNLKLKQEDFAKAFQTFLDLSKRLDIEQAFQSWRSPVVPK